MSWLDGLKHRIRIVLHPGAYERELEDEMRFHEELDAAQQEDAYRARRRFGNRTYYKEETRRLTWLGSLDVLRQDVSYAWRSIRRTPGFTAMVIVTLTLGIGVNAAVFTFLDRLFLRPPSGVQDPESLRRVWIRRFNTAGRVPVTHQSISYPWYQAVRAAADKSADIAMYLTSDGLKIGRDYGGPPVHGVYATANYFSVLGVRPRLGRIYAPDEDVMGKGANVAVITEVFWRTRLAGDPEILGKPLVLGTRRYTIVGVLDPSFVGLDVQPADVWMPLAAFPGQRQGRESVAWWQSATTYGARLVMRVVPGFDDRVFEARATVAIRRADIELRPERADTLANAFTGSLIATRGPGKLDQELLVATRVGGVVVIVLLIACANVVNLLLARAMHRRREIAVRLALGISRMRLIRLLSSETLLLALLSGVGAILAAWWGGGVLRTLLMPNIEWIDSALDGRIVLFTILLALTAGLAAGIIPALQASNPQLTSALKAGMRESTAHRSRLRSALVVIQAAFSVLLLVGAALFVRSLHNVHALDIGVDPAPLVFGAVGFEQGESPSDTHVAQGMSEIARRMEGAPNVEHVALSHFQPMRGYGVIRYYSGADSLGSFGEGSPFATAVSASYFQTVGTRFLRGSTFSGGESSTPPLEVVVSEGMANLFWPGRDAVGQCIRFGKRENPCHVVVGVVEDVRRWKVIEEQTSQFYLPIGGAAAPEWVGTDVIVRAAQGAKPAVATELRAAIQQAFPTGYAQVAEMTANLEPQYRPWRLGATLFTAFGVLALIVALVGVYSTVSYSVSQRTHEFGVRVALGARVADVLSLVVGEGLRVVALGVAVGVALALAAGKLISALLYGVEPSDPVVMLLVSVTLLIVAAIAALLPAWRAARVDPVTALRAD